MSWEWWHRTRREAKKRPVQSLAGGSRKVTRGQWPASVSRSHLVPRSPRKFAMGLGGLPRPAGGRMPHLWGSSRPSGDALLPTFYTCRNTKLHEDAEIRKVENPR